MPKQKNTKLKCQLKKKKTTRKRTQRQKRARVKTKKIRDFQRGSITLKAFKNSYLDQKILYIKSRILDKKRIKNDKKMVLF